MINAVVFMQQYFVEELGNPNEQVLLDNEQAHHIRRVLRMKTGDIIRLADGTGRVMSASVEIEKDAVYANIIEEVIDTSITKVKMILAQGMIKGEKWDYVLQKSAELGVQEFVPFVSSRCVVRLKDEKMDKKLSRWNKILLEASEQCKRSTLVSLANPCIFSDLKKINADLRIIAYEDADQISEKLCDVLASHKEIKSILLVVGCEGGFSKEEVEELVADGFHRVSLGGRILRAETAALSLLSNVEFFYDMEGDRK